MLSYVNRVQQLAIVLKAMDVCIKGREMAFAILNEPLLQFGDTTKTLGALGDDSKSFDLDIEKS